MQEAGLPLLGSWLNFYMILGTAAATLTGLMFIVITLVASIDVHVPTVNIAISAFNTPTVVHFCSVLLLAVLLSVPWHALAVLRLVLGLIGLGEVIYLITVIQSMRRIPGYQTPLRDWLWYSAAPVSCYVLLIAAALSLNTNTVLALYLIAAVMIALLFTGIRNAWDLLTYLAVDRAHSGASPQADPERRFDEQ